MIKILGIESTAHTFSVSVVESNNFLKGNILSNVKHSYIPPNGSGIHPREASRHHSKYCAQILKEALTKSNTKIDDIDGIAFAIGPGLGPCLRVGAVIARTLATYYSKPLIPVNHAIGHIELASMIAGVNDPIVLLVTGGHTLISIFSNKRWRIFGETLDITIGQLFDQFGRHIGFSSPCGMKIEELASNSEQYLELPYTVKGNDISLSGILTSSKKLLLNNSIETVANSIQETAFSMLLEVAERAVAFSGKNNILIAGGVAANKRLNQMLNLMSKDRGISFSSCPIDYSGDCGAQIAWTGLLAYNSGINVKVSNSEIKQSWRIDEVDIIWRK